LAPPEKANVDDTASKNQQCWDILGAATGHMPMVRAEVSSRGCGTSARSFAGFISRCWAVLGSAIGSASPANGQSGRTQSGKDRCVHSLPHSTVLGYS